MRRWAILLCLLCLFPVQVWATTFYVGKSGSDGNSCATAQSSTAANRKLTIGGGIGCLTGGAGDTLIIGNGTYTESTAVIPSGGGSYATATTIRAENSRLAIMQPGSGVVMGFYPGAAQPMTTQQWIIIQGLVLDATGTGTRAVEILSIPDADPNPPNHIRFTDTEIRNGSQHGMGWYNGNNLEFINNSALHDFECVAYGPGCVGIYWNADDSTMTGSDVYNITNTGGNAAVGLSIFTSSGFTPDNATVDSSRVFDIGNGVSPGLAINFSLATNPTVINTRIYRVTGGGGISAASSNPSVTGGRFDNNSFYDLDGDAIGLFDNSSGNFIRNNIFWNVAGTIAGSGYTASNNLSTNPSFTDPDNGDFSLLSTSTAIDAGTTLAHVTDDYAGTARPQGAAYDIGAFEFISGGEPAPAPPGGNRIVIMMRTLFGMALSHLWEAFTMLHTLLGLAACVPLVIGLWRARGRIIWYAKRAYLLVLTGLLRLRQSEPDMLTVEGALEEAEAILRDETQHART